MLVALVNIANVLEKIVTKIVECVLQNKLGQTVGSSIHIFYIINEHLSFSIKYKESLKFPTDGVSVFYIFMF